MFFPYRSVRCRLISNLRFVQLIWLTPLVKMELGMFCINSCILLALLDFSFITIGCLGTGLFVPAQRHHDKYNTETVCLLLDLRYTTEYCGGGDNTGPDTCYNEYSQVSYNIFDGTKVHRTIEIKSVTERYKRQVIFTRPL
jgi:hypothetical protein